MEREFDAYKLSRCMYLSIFNSFPVIRTASAKNRRFHVPQPIFLFPLETPLRLSRNMVHGWKDNLMLAKPLAACTYLSSIVSEATMDATASSHRLRFCRTPLAFDAVVNFNTFYRATRMHSADYAVARCLSVRPSVCLSHAGIVCKRLYISSIFSTVG